MDAWTTGESAGGGVGLRERRRRATRWEITDAALDLVLERGLADVTVEDIAHAAGVSPRTFFNYFPSKKSALVVCPSTLPPEAVEGFLADRETPVVEGLRRLLTAHLLFWSQDRQDLRRTQQVLAANPELIQAMHEQAMEFEAEFARVIALRMDLAADDCRPQVAAATACALLRRTVIRPGAEAACAATLSEDLARSFAALQELCAT